MENVPSPPPRAAAAVPIRERLYRAAAVMFIIAVAVGIFFVFLQFRILTLLLLMFAGLLLAIILRALGTLIRKLTGLGHVWAVVIGLILILGLLGLLGWLIAPRLATQAAEIIQQLPKSIARLREQLQHYWWSQYLFSQVSGKGGSLLSGGSSSWLDRVTGVASTSIDIGIDIIVVLFVGLYSAVEPRLYIEGLVYLVPAQRRERAKELISTLGYTLTWWLIGQAIIMVAVGVLTAVGLWLLGVPLALTLGVIAGFLEFAPYFGPLVSFGLAALIALMVSPVKALHVLLLYILAHILEGYILSPLVQRRTVYLPPALTILMQVLLGWLLGILGVMLAAPLTAAVITLVKMLYVEDTLKEDIEVAGEPEARQQVKEQTGEVGKAGTEKPSTP